MIFWYGVSACPFKEKCLFLCTKIKICVHSCGWVCVNERKCVCVLLRHRDLSKKGTTAHHCGVCGHSRLSRSISISFYPFPLFLPQMLKWKTLRVQWRTVHCPASISLIRTHSCQPSLLTHTQPVIVALFSFLLSSPPSLSLSFSYLKNSFAYVYSWVSLNIGMRKNWIFRNVSE